MKETKHFVEVKEDGKSVNFASSDDARAKADELKMRFPSAEFIIRPYQQIRYQVWTEKGTFYGQ